MVSRRKAVGKTVVSGEWRVKKTAERSGVICRVRSGFLSIKRMDNEGDSLGAFHLRIAAFDSGWANAAAEQDGLLHGFGYQ